MHSHGDKVALFAYGTHHNPKFWDDPEAFVPERWLGEAARKRKPYTYLPFGGGKRSCIGGAMSQVENVLALSILLRRSSVDSPPRIRLFDASADNDGE